MYRTSWRCRRRSQRARFFRPALEILEDRRLLTTSAVSDLGGATPLFTQSAPSNDEIRILADDPAAGDLLVTDLTAPATAVLGQDIQISWTITNQGSEPVPLAWLDQIVIGNPEDGNAGYFQVETSDDNNGTLDPGQSLERTQTITVPLGLSGGSTNLSVMTDAFGSQAESDEDNNSRSVSIEILAPDLTVTGLTVPEQVSPGDTFEVSWEVVNEGAVAAQADRYDSAILSQTSSFSESEVARDGKEGAALEAGERILVRATVTLPASYVGDIVYVTVQADSYLNQGETSEGNNAQTVSLPVKSPDLVATSATAPASGLAGDQIEVSWTIENQGEVAAPAGWEDRVYLSRDDQLGDEDIFLRAEASDGPLGVGASYTRTENVRLEDAAGFAPPPGDWYLLFVADGQQIVGETTKANNVRAVPFTMPGPDLAVTAVTAPTSAILGEEIQVSWTVTNIGAQPIPLDWLDENVIGNPDDDYAEYYDFDTYDENEGMLAPGQSLELTQTITIPFGLSGGPTALTVTTDSDDYQPEFDETNNSRSVTIDIAVPDLTVAGLTVPEEVSPGDSFEVSWEVVNEGTVAAQGQRADSAILSQSPSYSESAVTRSDQEGVPLEPAEHRQVTATVTLPSSYSGDIVYVTVHADSYGYQGETSNDNNMMTASVRVKAPDLVAISAEAPATGLVNDSIHVSWTVENQSEVATSAEWNDYVYLSQDDQLGDDILLHYSAIDPLAAGAGYTLAQDIPLINPSNGSSLSPGQYYLLFVADGSESLGETSEGNNLKVAPITLQGPDLEVTAATAPASAIEGVPFDVSWTVTNVGSFTAVADWADTVILSNSATFQENEGNALSTSFSDDQTPLAPGGSYEFHAQVTLPDGTTGTKYLHFVTNRYRSQGETDYGNNVRTVVIASQAPDLIVTSVEVPAQASSGEEITINWQVTNQSSVTATGTWSDRVYLTSDAGGGGDGGIGGGGIGGGGIGGGGLGGFFLLSEPIIIGGGGGGIGGGGSANDTVLGTFQFTGTLAPGETINRSATVTLPRDLSGTFRGRVQTNIRDDNGFQLPEENTNNNDGFSDETITIGLSPFPNLAAIAVTGPASAYWDTEKEVEWTVTNVGELATSASGWIDEVYLTWDPTLATGGILLGQLANPNNLAPGESYHSRLTVNIPVTLEGLYYFVVKTDADGAVYELNRETDNIAAGSQQVFISEMPPPDLQITQADAPATGILGETIDISWTVANVSDFLARGDWVDHVYLSTDETLDDNDTLLLEKNIDVQTPLDSNQSYQVQAQIGLPGGVEHLGRRYLIFRTNASPYQRQPESDDTNNIHVRALDLVAPDLQVTAATAPASAVLGQNIDVSWTVTNTSTIPANANWYDSVFLSSDSILDDADTRLYVNLYSPLQAGEHYQASAQVTVPKDFQFFGNQHLLFVADTYGIQSESDNGNNVRSLDINLFAPDLVVSNIEIPSLAVSGQEIIVKWTVTNQGNTAANGWLDRVFLSTDKQPGGELDFGTFEFEGTLQPGESIERQQTITVPIHESGSFFARIHTNDGDYVGEKSLGNNDGYSSEAIRVQLSPFPNLVVSEVRAPATIFSEETTEVEWTVTNVGEGATSAPFWYDSVWLSSDQFVGGDDIYLGAQGNASYLNPGESYANRLTVTLPRGIGGTYYFLVVTDWTGAVDELNRDGDNTGHATATQVTLSPFPDLEVTSVHGPGQTFSGVPIQVQWTVENRGTGDTSKVLVWYDGIYLSRDQALSFDDVELGTQYHFGDLAGSQANGNSLDPGESYTASATVTVPLQLSGDFYLLVVTDLFNHAYEFTFDNNNTNSTALQVHLQPPPDLEVTKVEVANQALAGRNLSIRYQVANLGSIETPTQYWSDSIYLSSTPEYNPADALLLGWVPRAGALAVNNTYQIETSYTLPYGLEGDFYVIVRADAGDNVFELDNDNNNVSSQHSIRIESKPADLRVVSVAAPATAQAGKAIHVEWTVSNSGIGDTVVNQWTDQVYISTDNVRGNDALLASVSHGGLLDAGESYTASANFTIPLTYSGPVYFFVLTDVVGPGGQVFEADGENNNGSTLIRVEVSRQLADLQVTSVTAPASVQAGDTIEVQYTVENRGNATTDSSYWFDSIYLVDNQGRVTSIGDYRHVNTLKPGESYQVTRSLTVPIYLSGDFYVQVTTDVQLQVTEAENDANNSRLSLGTVHVIALPPEQQEQQAEPVYDFTVSEVTAPDTVVAGAQLTINWTDFNLGDLYGGALYDSVYLSRDKVLDRRSDIYLGYGGFSGNIGNINPGTERLGGFRVPEGLSGLFYVLVATDSIGAISEVNETNNIGRTAEPILITLQPPADLVAGSITIPANARPGDSITIQYSVTNQGDSPARGNWFDSLYLSADDTWQVGDVFLGRVEHFGGLEAASSYGGILQTRLPGVVPGDYHVIVRSDILNNVRESNENNNLSASLDRVDIDVPRLELGTTVFGSLNPSQPVYYQVEIEEGEALLLNLEKRDGHTNFIYNELYVRYGAMPTRGQFDFAYSKPLEAEQQILVPQTKAGTYYVMAYSTSRAIGSGGIDPFKYWLTAQTIDFSILDTGYGKGGTAGNRTIEINGAKFDRTVTAKLTNDAGFELAALAMYYTSSSRLYATFDLTQAAPGHYDVVLENGQGESARVEDGLEVVLGGAGHLAMAIQAPPTVRLGNPTTPPFSFLVTWENDGYTDLRTPFIDVSINTHLADDSKDFSESSMRLFGRANGDGLPGLFMPGQVGLKRLFAEVGGAQVAIQARDAFQGLLDDPFPWETAPEVQSATLRTGDAFTELVNQLRSQVGTRWVDFLDMLSRNANLIPEELGSPDSVADLVALEVRDAEAALTTSVRGRIDAASMAVKLAGREVVLLDQEGRSKSVLTLNDGSFVFADLQPGTYRIQVPAAVIADPENGQFTVAEGQKISGLNIKIEAGATLDITVRDANGELADSAGVFLVQGKQVIASAFTDSEGRAVLTALPSGHFTLLAQSGSDQTLKALEIEIGSGKQQVALELEAGSRVEGRILSANDEPVDLAILMVRTLDNDPFKKFIAASQEDGTFAFQGLLPGQYRAIIAKTGFTTQIIQFDVAANQNQLNLGDIQLQPAVEGAAFTQADDGEGEDGSGFEFIGDILGLIPAGYEKLAAYMNSKYPYTDIQAWQPEKVEELKKAFPKEMVPTIFAMYVSGGQLINGAMITLMNGGVFGGSYAFNALLQEFLLGKGGFYEFGDDSSLVAAEFRNSSRTKALFYNAYETAVAGLRDLLADRQIGDLAIDRSRFNDAGVATFSLSSLLKARGIKINKDLSWREYITGNMALQSFGVDPLAVAPDGRAITEVYWQWAPPNPAGGAGGADMNWPMNNPDTRSMLGDVSVIIDDTNNTITINPVHDWQMSIGDYFDFLPGNLGDGAVKMGTLPLAVLEAYGKAKDVPFTVHWSNQDYNYFRKLVLPLPDYLKKKKDDGCTQSTMIAGMYAMD